MIKIFLSVRDKNDEEIKRKELLFKIQTTEVETEIIKNSSERLIETHIEYSVAIDETEQFCVFTAREFNELFTKYFIPTLKNESFMIPIKDYQQGNLIIPVWKKSLKNETTTFKHGLYKYSYNINSDMFFVKYEGDKTLKEITEYPFGSFNGKNISYKNLYSNTKIKNFDFNNLNMSCCVDSSGMFSNCDRLEEVKDIVFSRRIGNISEMFSYCFSLKHCEFIKNNIVLDTLNAKNIFAFCVNLLSVDISTLILKGKYTFDISPFIGCKSLSKIVCQTYTWTKIKDNLCHREFWAPELTQKQRLKKLKECRTITLKTDNNKLYVEFINSFFIKPSLVNIKNDIFYVLPSKN